MNASHCREIFGVHSSLNDLKSIANLKAKGKLAHEFF